ncbi:hypothetical protein REPUB_Repub19eG0075200 [Reevesia pubescens]
MLTTIGSAVLPCKVTCLHQESLCRVQQSAISKQKNDQLFQRNQTFPLLNTGSLRILQTNRNTKMKNMVVRNSSETGAPPFPFNLLPGSNNWLLWVLGTVISLILPFTTSKWGPLLKLKNEADHILQTAENISDAVEAVAEKVEKIADEIGDQLPEGGKLRATLELVEDLAEETAKNAHLTGDLIDKVQEMEDKMESFMESVDAKGNQKPKEA